MARSVVLVRLPLTRPLLRLLVTSDTASYFRLQVKLLFRLPVASYTARYTVSYK